MFVKNIFYKTTVYVRVPKVRFAFSKDKFKCIIITRPLVIHCSPAKKRYVSVLMI